MIILNYPTLTLVIDSYTIIQQFSTAGGGGDEIEKAQNAQKTSEPTIFSKIIDKTIPADIIYEDDQVETIAFARVVKTAESAHFDGFFISSEY